MILIFAADWDKLKEIEFELRHYAHGSGCENIFVCPKDHRHPLTLDTSLAWGVSCQLRKAIDMKALVEMEDILQGTLVIYGALKRHADEYPLLMKLVKGIFLACKKKSQIDREYSESCRV